MTNHRTNRLLKMGIAAKCLLLLFAASARGQDEVPGLLPLASIAGEGGVASFACDDGECFRLSFDAKFRLNPRSDGIVKGDDLEIATELAYPVPALQDAFFGLPFQRLVVRLAVDGQCFRPRGRALLFKAEGKGATADCVEAGMEITDSQGKTLLSLDLGEILRMVNVQLMPVGRDRWKLRSVASFFNPGYPFPVAGFGYDAAGNRISGVNVTVGDDAGFSPFRTVGFRTLAP